MSKSEKWYEYTLFWPMKMMPLVKVMKAKQTKQPTEPNSPNLSILENIFGLMQLVSTPDVIAKIDEDYNNCSIRYGDFKNS